MRRRPAFTLASLAAAAFLCEAQTTQGLIRGRVYDAATDAGLANATLNLRNFATGTRLVTRSSPDGYYVFPPLSPGTYWLRIQAAKYQPREVYNLEVPVAARVQLNAPLRLLSDIYSSELYAGSYVPETEAIIHVYAADLRTVLAQPLLMLLGRSGTLHATLSYLIDPVLMRNLPLSGRDVYTTLVTLPGVTADSPTARGLGVSVNGQRSSSSNFLLDGVENNDTLLTGPETVIAPEAVEEYRVSTNNFSAEFGRSAGFVANAITRGGSNAPHGVVYGYMQDTVLNANGYQHKAGLNTSTGVRRPAGTLPRQPQTQLQAGFWLGGPLRRDRTFGSAAYERFRLRSSADPFPLTAPVSDRISRCYPGGYADTLLTRFPPPIPAGLEPFRSCASLSATFDIRPPISQDRNLLLARVDHLLTRSGNHRLLARVARSDSDRPDFDYSPYAGLSSNLYAQALNVALGYTWTPQSPVTNDFRAARRRSNQGWGSPVSNLPALITFMDGSQLHNFGVNLPGNFLFPYRFDAGVWEFTDTVRLVRGRHVISAGGGFLFSRSSSDLRFREPGLYFFDRLQDFGAGTPRFFQIAAERLQLPAIVTPRFDRSYRSHQFHGFVQDSIRVTPRFGLNGGIRYEYFGAPRNTGPLDTIFQADEGANIEERIARGSLVDDAGVEAYRADRNDWAARLGVFYDVGGRSQTVLRGGYGIFYDRPFGNLFQNLRNNSMDLALISPATSFPSASPTALQGRALNLLRVLWLDPNLRTPYVQSWFGGVQRQFNEDLYVEWSAQGALGRKLIGTDRVNRQSIAEPPARLNPAIDDEIVYRSNFVSSSYSAMTAQLRYRTPNAHFQAAYTWGHSIDNQSDPLQGTFEDLGAFRNFGSTSDNLASLTQVFDTRADRGSSDFDQRHNLVFFSVWSLPFRNQRGWKGALLRDWQIAQIAGFRSGFPFNVIVSGDGLLPQCPGAPVERELVRPRPSLMPGIDPWVDSPAPVPGGYQLLNPAAFCDPGSSLGTLGRNAMTGPGFWNVDFSLAKSFRPGWLGEAGAIQVRADIFNLFNHANLGNPNGLLDFGNRGTFGHALLGRQGAQPAFPSQTPLDQLPRQIQVQLKWMF